jgi:hypothetical protein
VIDFTSDPALESKTVMVRRSASQTVMQKVTQQVTQKVML